MANPAVTATPDGRFLMIYKGVTSGNLPFGSRVLHGLAMADHPAGPFVKKPAPVFVLHGEEFPFEDPHIWQEGGKYFCLLKDMVGLRGSFPRATLLFESADGVNWRMEDYRLIATPHVRDEDGTVLSMDKLERPAYFAHATLPMLSFAVKPPGDGLSYIVFCPCRPSDLRANHFSEATCESENIL